VDTEHEKSFQELQEAFKDDILNQKIELVFQKAPQFQLLSHQISSKQSDPHGTVGCILRAEECWYGVTCAHCV
jgi:hypothetical protein